MLYIYIHILYKGFNFSRHKSSHQCRLHTFVSTQKPWKGRNTLANSLAVLDLLVWFGSGSAVEPSQVPQHPRNASGPAATAAVRTPPIEKLTNKTLKAPQGKLSFSRHGGLENSAPWRRESKQSAVQPSKTAKITTLKKNPVWKMFCLWVHSSVISNTIDLVSPPPGGDNTDGRQLGGRGENRWW